MTDKGGWLIHRRHLRQKLQGNRRDPFRDLAQEQQGRRRFGNAGSILLVGALTVGAVVVVGAYHLNGKQEIQEKTAEWASTLGLNSSQQEVMVRALEESGGLFKVRDGGLRVYDGGRIASVVQIPLETGVPDDQLVPLLKVAGRYGLLNDDGTVCTDMVRAVFRITRDYNEWAALAGQKYLQATDVAYTLWRNRRTDQMLIGWRVKHWETAAKNARKRADTEKLVGKPAGRWAEKEAEHSEKSLQRWQRIEVLFKLAEGHPGWIGNAGKG